MTAERPRTCFWPRAAPAATSPCPAPLSVSHHANRELRPTLHVAGLSGSGALCMGMPVASVFGGEAGRWTVFQFYASCLTAVSGDERQARAVGQRIPTHVCFHYLVADSEVDRGGADRIDSVDPPPGSYAH